MSQSKNGAFSKRLFNHFFNSNELNVEMLYKAFFIYFSALMVAGALVWGIICLYFDKGSTSIIPFSYIGITFINFVICNKFSGLKVGCHIQIFFTILLPFIFQYALGGIANSGVVMLWSTVALISGVTLQSKFMNKVWLSLILILTISSIAVEIYFFSVQTNYSFNPILGGLNISMVTVILFLLSSYFIQLQIALRKNLKRNRESLKTKNDELFERNKEIKQSFSYAQSLQTNILPRMENIKSAFEDAAIFFKPKDVVSGDFYWFGKCEGKTILAAVDCTGHGIPGALMSVMGYNLLNSIILNKKSVHPGVILQQLNKEVKKSLKQDFSGNHDGMDVSIISYDPVTKILEFAGAKNDLFIKRKDEKKVERIKGSKFSIGGISNGNVSNYCTHICTLQKESTFILTSDGYIDQFGGRNNKRFMNRRFVSLLEELDFDDLSIAMNGIKENFNNWKGNEIQTDDVMVLGLKINPIKEPYIALKAYNNPRQEQVSNSSNLTS